MVAAEAAEQPPRQTHNHMPHGGQAAPPAKADRAQMKYTGHTQAKALASTQATGTDDNSNARPGHDQAGPGTHNSHH